jgi:hypothetical protein
MLVLAGILLILGAVALVLYPLVSHQTAPLTDGPDVLAELRELHALRDMTYETVRDLEFDFHAGKIGEADFKELRDRYAREAMDVVRRIDDIEAHTPDLKTRTHGRA